MKLDMYITMTFKREKKKRKGKKEEKEGGEKKREKEGRVSVRVNGFDFIIRRVIYYDH